MLKLYIQLQALSVVLAVRRMRPGEHGSVTIEHVGWAVAVIAIVGIVVAAITSYVTKQSGNIK